MHLEIKDIPKGILHPEELADLLENNEVEEEEVLLPLDMADLLVLEPLGELPPLFGFEDQWQPVQEEEEDEPEMELIGIPSGDEEAAGVDDSGPPREPGTAENDPFRPVAALRGRRAAADPVQEDALNTNPAEEPPRDGAA